MTAGCGAVQAPNPRSPPYTGQPASPPSTGTATPSANPSHQGGTLTTHSAAPEVPPGCHGATSAGTAGSILTITLASNSKSYCLRVGDTLRLSLRGTEPDPWQSPQVTGSALMPVPGTGSAVANGITDATYVAVRPGQVILVSVRPPCQIAFPPQKGDLQPRFRSCSPGHFFSTSISVLR
jgi:hypothetical protein